MHNKIRRNNSGFTLIELSVVIVLISLIVASVIGAKNLIETAKLRKLINQVDQHKVAFNAFFLEYQQIPGDMRNASAYWSSCVTANGSICNGDGNRRYGDWGSNEGERGWHHLSLAGLLPYSFDNSQYCAVIGGWANSESKPGVTSPKFDKFGENEVCSKFWRETHGLFGSLSGKNIMTIRGVLTSDVNHTCWQGMAGLSGSQGLQVDQKIDDGVRTTGKMTGDGSGDGSCEGLTSGWSVDDTPGDGCSFFFELKE